MAEAFTMFEKFGDALEVLGEDDRKTMFYALGMYGSYGVEIELPPYLRALFIAFKEDIDNSKASRRNGANGGRPSKKKQGVSDTSEPSATGNDKPPLSESGKPTLFDVGKPVVSENMKPKPIQAKPIQANPVSNGKGGKPPFRPPTVAEVAEYAKQRGTPIDAQRFVDYFAAQGWKLSNGNAMKDWQAAVRNWCARDTRGRRQKGVTIDDELASYGI